MNNQEKAIPEYLPMVIINNPVYLEYERLNIDRFAAPITDAICKYFKCKPTFFKRKTNKMEVVKVRKIYAYLLVKEGRFSTRQVGILLGGYDHSNVSHCIRAVNIDLSYVGANGNKRPVNPDMIRMIAELKDLIKKNQNKVTK